MKIKSFLIKKKNHLVNFSLTLDGGLNIKCNLYEGVLPALFENMQKLTDEEFIIFIHNITSNGGRQ